ncbi:hypothetical protein SPURM210S_01907 [Streptomyces purpurascens]
MPSCTVSSWSVRRLTGSGLLAITTSTPGSALPTVYLRLTSWSPCVNCSLAPGRRAICGRAVVDADVDQALVVGPGHEERALGQGGEEAGRDAGLLGVRRSPVEPAQVAVLAGAHGQLDLAGAEREGDRLGDGQVLRALVGAAALDVLELGPRRGLARRVEDDPHGRQHRTGQRPVGGPNHPAAVVLDRLQRGRGTEGSRGDAQGEQLAQKLRPAGRGGRAPGRVETAEAGVEGGQETCGVGARELPAGIAPGCGGGGTRCGKYDTQGVQSGSPRVALKGRGELRDRPRRPRRRRTTHFRLGRGQLQCTLGEFGEHRLQPLEPRRHVLVRRGQHLRLAKTRERLGEPGREPLGRLDLLQVATERFEDLILEVLDQPADRTRVGNLRGGRLLSRFAGGSGLGGPATYLVDEFLESRRSRLRQGDRRDLVVPVDPRLRHGKQLACAAGAFPEDEQQLVACLQGECRALDEELGALLEVLRGEERGTAAADLQLVEVPAGRQVPGGLERQRRLVGGRGDAVAARAARIGTFCASARGSRSRVYARCVAAATPGRGRCPTSRPSSTRERCSSAVRR